MTDDQMAATASDSTFPHWTWRCADGFGALARFVSLEAVKSLNLAAPRTTDELEPEDDLRVARTLYEALARQRIDPGLEPWTATQGVQVVRDPREVVRGKYGNCLELAILYAGLCLQSHVAPLLATFPGHAFVVLHPGRLEDDAQERTGAGRRSLDLRGAWGGTPAPRDLGAFEVTDETAFRETIRARRLVAIDPFCAVHQMSFEDAVRCGKEHLLKHRLCLVDVLSDQDRPDRTKLPPPSRLADVRPYVPGGDDAFVAFPSRTAVEADLRRRTGIVALVGDAGTGKSVLARHIASTLPSGAAWFLDATDPQSLINSLATAHRANDERDMEGVEARNQEEYAEAALRRLARSREGWVVVLDNADGDPKLLRRFLPTPDPALGQLVILTTTRGDWDGQPGVRPLPLAALNDDEVAARLPGRDLRRLVLGRPLLTNAFARYLSDGDRAARLDAAIDEVAANEVGEELRGPAVLWAAIRRGYEGDEHRLRLATQLALLSPDHQPIAVLEALTPDARVLLRDFAASGLFGLGDEDDALRLHRLFGRAIRADVAKRAPGLYREVAISIARNELARDAVRRHGNIDASRTLRTPLLDPAPDTGEPSAALGEALFGVAELLELHGDTKESGDLYEHARRHLADPAKLAICHLSQARTVNQRHPNDAVRLDQAIERAVEGEGLVPPERSGRYVAMQGLLLQKLAKTKAREDDRKALLEEAAALVERAHELREAEYADDPTHPELLRSRFNFGGVGINRAQSEPAAAATHLQMSADAYTHVAAARVQAYGVEIHPHIAACHSGLALVHYYRAMLVPASEVQRSAWLRAAFDEGSIAFKQREAIDGPIDGPEIRKIAQRMVKIVLARGLDPARRSTHVGQAFDVFKGGLSEVLGAPDLQPEFELDG